MRGDGERERCKSGQGAWKGEGSNWSDNREYSQGLNWMIIVLDRLRRTARVFTFVGYGKEKEKEKKTIT